MFFLILRDELVSRAKRSLWAEVQEGKRKSVNPSSAPGNYSCPGIYSHSASGNYSIPSEEVTVYFH